MHGVMMARLPRWLVGTTTPKILSCNCSAEPRPLGRSGERSFLGGQSVKIAKPHHHKPPVIWIMTHGCDARLVSILGNPHTRTRASMLICVIIVRPPIRRTCRRPSFIRL